jgi:hypothetical protein
MKRLWQIMSTPFRRAPRRPLAARRPGRAEMGQIRTVPLGMEAIDMALVDQTNRRNDALERTHAIKTDTATAGGYTVQASTHVNPMPEDETYAARFHRAYMKKDS